MCKIQRRQGKSVCTTQVRDSWALQWVDGTLGRTQCTERSSHPVHLGISIQVTHDLIYMLRVCFVFSIQDREVPVYSPSDRLPQGSFSVICCFARGSSSMAVLSWVMAALGIPTPRVLYGFPQPENLTLLAAFKFCNLYDPSSPCPGNILVLEVPNSPPGAKIYNQSILAQKLL